MSSNTLDFTYDDLQSLGIVEENKRGLDVVLVCNANAVSSRYKTVFIVGSPLRLDNKKPPIYALGYVSKCKGKKMRFVYVTHSFDKQYEIGETYLEYIWLLAVPKWTCIQTVKNKVIQKLVEEVDIESKKAKNRKPKKKPEEKPFPFEEFNKQLDGFLEQNGYKRVYGKPYNYEKE